MQYLLEGLEPLELTSEHYPKVRVEELDNLQLETKIILIKKLLVYGAIKLNLGTDTYLNKEDSNLLEKNFLSLKLHCYNHLAIIYNIHIEKYLTKEMEFVVLTNTIKFKKDIEPKRIDYLLTSMLHHIVIKLCLYHRPNEFYGNFLIEIDKYFE